MLQYRQLNSDQNRVKQISDSEPRKHVVIIIIIIKSERHDNIIV